jgi:hypothetical protein
MVEKNKLFFLVQSQPITHVLKRAAIGLFYTLTDIGLKLCSYILLSDKVYLQNFKRALSTYFQTKALEIWGTEKKIRANNLRIFGSVTNEKNIKICWNENQNAKMDEIFWTLEKDTTKIS